MLAPGEGLPGRVWASGEPAWIADVRADASFPRGPSAARAGLRAAFCFPIRGATGVLGAIEFLAKERRDPDANLLATMTSLGGRIGHCVERWRAEDRLRESDARKSAILDAAFDCIITMDADGNVVEVNPATERTFGYTAAEMVGRELAELIIPAVAARAAPARRRALRRDGRGDDGRPSGGAPGDALGRQRVPRRDRDHPAAAGRARRCSPGSCATSPSASAPSRRCATLADEQAALRRVATTVASEAAQERVFAVVTEEVGRLLGAQSSNMVRFEPDGTGLVTGAWSTGSAPSVPVGTREALDGPTAAARIRDSGLPERVDSYEGVPGSTAAMLRDLGFRSSVGAPIKLAGRLWGAVMVSTVEARPFPAGIRAADRRLRGARRARARERRGAARAGGFARAHRRDRRRRAAAPRAQPARRRAAAAGRAPC